MLSLFIFAGVTQAQPGSKTDSSVEAEQTLSGSFIQNRFLKGFDAPLKTRGEFFLVPNVGLAWMVKKPFESRLIMTDDGITQVTHGKVMNIGGADIAKIIAGMMYPALAGDWPKLEQDFEIQKSSATNDGASWQITLRPRSDQMRAIITKIIVEGGEVTQSLILHKASGDRDEISFRDQKLWDKAPLTATDAFIVPQDK